MKCQGQSFSDLTFRIWNCLSFEHEEISSNKKVIEIFLSRQLLFAYVEFLKFPISKFSLEEMYNIISSSGALILPIYHFKIITSLNRFILINLLVQRAKCV